MTGYTASDILGRNCRILQVSKAPSTAARSLLLLSHPPVLLASQGPGTSTQAVMEIRDAIREERAASVCLLNYRKDKTPFFNAFYIAPVRSATGIVEYFIGIQSDVTHLTSDEASLAAVTAAEAAHAQALAADLQTAGPGLMRGHPTCAVCDSLPSSLLGGLAGVVGAFVLADASAPDMPICFASAQFLQLTGYSCDEVVGRNCRFLQGPGTDPAAVQTIRDALNREVPVTVTLLNYKKNGTPFYNCLHISPVRNSAGQVVYYCAVQVEVDGERAWGRASAAGADAAMVAEGDAQGDLAPNGKVPEPTAMQLLQQKGTVGAVKVAARALSGSGLRRSGEDQHPPERKM